VSSSDKEKKMDNPNSVSKKVSQLSKHISDEEKFDEALKEFTKLKNEYVVSKMKWYQKNAPRHFWSFRISGVLIILLSVSVPFMTSLSGFWKDTVLPISTLLIAGLTGLNSFMQWQEGWKEYRKTQFAIEYLLTKWEFEVTKAINNPNKKQALNALTRATSSLLENTKQISARETETFFERVEAPTGKTQ
jgi:hypothetical protein